VEFEGLIVLALDLEFGLEFLDQEFETRNFGAKFVDVGSAGSAMSHRRGLGRLWRGRILLGEGIG